MGVWNKPFHVFLFLHCVYVVVKGYFDYNAQYHRVFSDTVSWYDLRSFLLFEKYTLLVIAVLFTIHIAIGMSKNIQSTDKYVSRGMAYLTITVLTYYLPIVCHGWLLDYIDRIVRLICFVSSLHVGACGVMIVVVTIKSKIKQFKRRREDGRER